MTDVGDALKWFVVGGAIGATVMFVVSKPGFKIGFQGTANAYPAFGYDYGTDVYNNSEVWDIRDRIFKNDNVLYNKTPHIALKPSTDWDPANVPLKFIGSYTACSDDSPRPRLEHFLDSM